MATLIKSNGEVTEVKPAKGKKFTLQELQGYVGGYIERFQVKDKHWIWNEEGLIYNLPENLKATEVLYATSGRPVQTLVGDILICSSSEFN